MSKNISRKNFLKNLGIVTLSVPGISAFANDAEGTKNNSFQPADDHFIKNTDSKKPGKKWITRRGSWVRKGDATSGDVILAKGGKGCSIIINEKEHSAVQQAGKFLSEDIRKISGYQPKISQKPVDGNTNLHLVTLGNEFIPKEINVEDIKGRWEACKIVTHNDEVWLIGSDFRGTAYAVYTLSERLGIDPLYLWTGYRPVKHETLILKKTIYSSDSPTFKYRGFFHDDEDILPRPYEWGGYPLRVGDIDLLWYQKYFETALRLRMNMVAPYTRVHRRYEVQQCAGNWGLIYTSHHYDILLSNPFGLVRFGLAEKRNVKPEWDWAKNKEGMTKYWRGGVWENKDLDCIWPVGLRGTNDYPYQFPKGMSESDETKVFNQVIETQVETVKEVLPCTQPPVYAFTLWDEMIRKYESDKKNFVLPEDVMIIWSDNMNGEMTHLPSSTGKWKHGIYYHLAMYGGGVTKQGTHIVSPFTINEAFQKTLDAGATEYMLVNVSELRDYVMGAQQIADICWDAPAMLDREKASVNKGQPGEEYLKWWCNEYFGADAADDAVEVYKQYYKIYDHPTKLWFAADIIWHQLEELVKKFNGEAYKMTENKDLTILNSRNKAFQKAIDTFSKASSKMDPSQRQFFFENTKLGLSFDWRPTQAALLLHQAMLEKDINKAWEYVHQAIQPLEQLELDILKAERPPFSKWYRDTWIRGTLTPLNVHRSYLLVQAFISSEGTASKPPKRPGHDNLEQSKIWSDFLEASEKLNDPLSRY